MNSLFSSLLITRIPTCVCFSSFFFSSHLSVYRERLEYWNSKETYIIMTNARKNPPSFLPFNEMCENQLRPSSKKSSNGTFRRYHFAIRFSVLLVVGFIFNFQPRRSFALCFEFKNLELPRNKNNTRDSRLKREEKKSHSLPPRAQFTVISGKFC